MWSSTTASARAHLLVSPTEASAHSDCRAQATALASKAAPFCLFRARRSAVRHRIMAGTIANNSIMNNGGVGIHGGDM